MAKRQLYSTMVAEDLKKFIATSALKPGDQLPTESQLCEKYDVSRTVVREALSRLRSENILVVRQGKGVFVAELSPDRPFAVNWNALQGLPETLELMQLRLAVETESAGLCAVRRSAKDLAHIHVLLASIDADTASNESPQIIYDYAFHLAIAQASGNAYIFQFLKFLEPVIVSRFSINEPLNRQFSIEYAKIARLEHQAIIRAIEKQDEAAARSAMRKHLSNSIARLSKLAAHLNEPAVNPIGSNTEQVIGGLINTLTQRQG
ncbi:MAG: FadR/GntR family transcriptional regulator [Pseudomonadota bacterium]